MKAIFKGVFIFCVAFSTLNLYSQNRPGQQVLSFGVGGSALGMALRIGTAAIPEKIAISPMLSLSYESSFDSIFSLGGIYSLQTFSISVKNGNYTDKVSILHNNFAIRPILHLNKRAQNSDFYLGCRLGYSIFNFRSTLPISSLPKEAFSVYGAYSFQALLGYRVYLSQEVGLGFELALGRPYFASLFLCYRFGNISPPKNLTPATKKSNSVIQYK